MALSFLANRSDRAVEIRPDTIHLVDEHHSWNAVAIGLIPDRLRLRLDSRHCVKHRDHPIEHPQGTLDLDGKVNMPRRVDDVDLVVLPKTSRRRRGDGDAALLLLHHPVHRRRAVMHLADLVYLATIIKYALGGSGLACVDVCHQPDVAHILL